MTVEPCIAKFMKVNCLSWCRALAAEKQITEKVFFDLTLDGQGVGRVVIGLYGNDVPKTAENFASLGISCRLLHRVS